MKTDSMMMKAAIFSASVRSTASKYYVILRGLSLLACLALGYKIVSVFLVVMLTSENSVIRIRPWPRGGACISVRRSLLSTGGPFVNCALIPSCRSVVPVVLSVLISGVCLYTGEATMRRASSQARLSTSAHTFLHPLLPLLFIRTAGSSEAETVTSLHRR